MTSSLPLPDFFDRALVDKVWRVPYETRAAQAADWARLHGLQPAEADGERVWLLLIDVQNTFCLPDFELFVAGRSGSGAVDDNVRLCEFIYRHLGSISQISATMDTHQAAQIFHAIFLVNEKGEHPAPYTLVRAEEVRNGAWKFNPELAGQFGVTPGQGQERLLYYVSQLEARGKYDLTIWPYHAMLGGIGHALVSAVEEALFFHSIARRAYIQYEIKGNRPFTENYSAIGPEVEKGPHGEILGEHNPKFIETLKRMDKLIIAGQAKSHCVAWTVADLLNDIRAADPALAKKVYLLEDCMSPVVVPGADFTEAAGQAFGKFAEAGMHIVRSSELFLEA